MKMKKFAIIDLECTCSNDGSIPRDEMEIIEIGCVITDIDGNISDEIDIFVKPIIHTELTDFCIELTGITQEKVDDGVSLNEALHRLNSFMISNKVEAWMSWGYFDKNQLDKEANKKLVYKENASFFVIPHINLSDKYVQTKNLKRKVGLRKALAQNNMQFIGRPHSGIDDVRNIARLLNIVEL
jgi:inhibitor of KinA sporulation pathway (predicted exonuclease)